MADDSAEVVLKLTKDEALVLFEFVSRFTDSDVLDIQDRAEAQALWNVCGSLENELVDPFDSKYTEDFRGEVEDLTNSLLDRMLHYQAVLESHGIDFPHVRAFSETDRVELVPHDDS